MTAENVELFLAQLDGHESDEAFVESEILDPVPFLFDDDDVSFGAFRAEIALTLGVDPAAVFVTGSGAIGYSLAPAKFGRPFDRHSSDIDVAVADEQLFREMWDDLLIRDRTGRPNKSHIRRNVYWGKVDHKHFSRAYDPGKKLSRANRSARAVFDDRLDCSIRVYRNLEQLLRYQVYSIRQALKEMRL